MRKVILHNYCKMSIDFDVSRRLVDFIRSERERFSTEHNNMFGTSFSQITRYYEFLSIVFRRYKEASIAFTENTKALQATFKSGHHEMTSQQMSLHEEGVRATTALHLEIESFYLFAKILLDKVAHALEFYFGKVNRRPLDSHDDLTKNLEAYAQSKGLLITTGLFDLIRKLKEDISDHRDYQIAHEKSPRTLRATGFDEQGNTKIIGTKLYPKEGDRQNETKLLEELLTEINEYLDMITEFIQQNGNKTRLKLNTSRQ